MFKSETYIGDTNSPKAKMFPAISIQHHLGKALLKCSIVNQIKLKLSLQVNKIKYGTTA